MWAIMVASLVAPQAQPLATSPFQKKINKNTNDNPFQQYYPANWPYVPFHEGEIQLQKATGTHKSVMTYAPRFIRPFMPQQHVDFYENQPFLIAAARDTTGSLWATLLTHPTGENRLTTSPDPRTLHIAGAPVRGDALAGDALQPGTDVGLLGIEFATKRRNRVNGRITQVKTNINTNSTDDSSIGPSLVFEVDQSFGNCPQYITPRQWWTAEPQHQNDAEAEEDKNTGTCDIPRRRFPSKLTLDQMKTVQNANTIFVATGYRGEGEDPRYGNDASHRGGPAGFLMVQEDAQTIILPDFSGNNHFNSIGNLLMDNRMGLTIPSWEEGGMLQLSGTAQVDLDSQKAAQMYPGAQRLVIFRIEKINTVPAGSLPVRFSQEPESSSRQVQVSGIVQESEDVKSFYFQPLSQDMQTLWDFTAGQHLPIQLRTPFGELQRTYSLSSSPYDDSEYRISVKREPSGKASSYLHYNLQIGDVIQVQKPAGDFMLPKKIEETDEENPLVLLSSGIGVTPILSMLQQHVEQVAQSTKARHRRVYWIHGARDEDHHPFQGEVDSLIQQSKGTVQKHVAYSRPLKSDTASRADVSSGRLNMKLLSSLVPDLPSATVFMCGSSSFMAAMEDGLLNEGLDQSRIHFETF